MLFLRERYPGAKPVMGARLSSDMICRGIVGAWPCNELGGKKIYSLVNPADTLSSSNSTEQWSVSNYSSGSGLAVVTGASAGFSNDNVPSSLLQPSTAVTLYVRGTSLGAASAGDTSFPHLFIVRYTNSSTSPFWAYGLIRDRLDATKVYWKCSAGGADNTITLTPLTNNKGFSLALTYEAGTGKLLAYSDGFQIGTASLSGNLAYGATPQMFLGVSETGQVANIFMDVVYVWARALAPAEIWRLHESPYLPLESPRRLWAFASTNVNISESISPSAAAALAFATKQAATRSLSISGTGAVSLAIAARRVGDVGLGAVASVTISPANTVAENISAGQTASANMEGSRGVSYSINPSAGGSMTFNEHLNAIADLPLSGVGASFGLNQSGQVGNVELPATPALAVSAASDLRDALTASAAPAISAAGGKRVAEAAALSAAGAVTEAATKTANPALDVSATPDMPLDYELAAVGAVDLATDASAVVFDNSKRSGPGIFEPDATQGTPGLFKPRGSSATPGVFKPAQGGTPGIFKPD